MHAEVSGRERSKAASELRLLSFNIQAGTSTNRYRHYVTRGWRQLLPHSDRVRNLDAIAELISDFDIVGLQEVDSGSLRSGFVNQTQYLANHSGLPFWTHQKNRKVGTVAHPGNGLLSRLEPLDVIDHRLPGAIPGRGCLLVRYGAGESILTLVLVHLALGRKARQNQLDYMADLLADNSNCVVLGDLNTEVTSPELSRFIQRLDLRAPTAELKSFPSWRPQRSIDHILLSSSLHVDHCEVIDGAFSDHCPVAVIAHLPDTLKPLTESMEALV